jgi:hypothetical protein
MANEFIVRKGLVVSGASQQALRTVGNGNILVGSGSTDSGYTFQAVGSVLFVGSGTSSSTSLSVRNIAGDIRLNVQNDGLVLVGTGLSNGLGAIIRDSVYNTGLGIHGNDEIRLYSNNAVPFYTKYAGGGTPIKLAPYINGVVISTDVTNAASIPDASATFQVTGSRTASSSIARGVFFNNTLTSAANGDTLIGLDVRPTFSVGSYSGYTLLSLRSSGDTLFTTTGGTNTLRTFRTGNILIGSGSTDLGSTLSVIGSSLMSGNTSGSTLLNVVGSQGQLFSVVDTLTGSLMSVNDITGLPILEVFSDDRVVMGEYATNALVVSGRSTGFGVTPSDPNYRIISSGSTLFSGGTMVVKGSGTTSGSIALSVQNSTGGTLLNLFNNGNLNIDSGVLYVDGDTGNVGIGTSNPINKLHISGSAGDIVYIVANTGQSAVIGATGSGTNRMYIGYSPGTENISITSGNVVRLNPSGSGNVLIGTTTDAGYKLDVNGTARLNSTTLIEGPLTVNFGGVGGGTSIVANGNTFHNGGRGIYTTGYAYGIQANHTMVGNWGSQPNAAGVHGTGQIGVFGSGDIAGFSGPSAFFTVLDGNNRVSARSHISTFQIRGSGSTELTNTLLLENSSGIKTFTVNDNGNVLIGLSGSTGQKLQVSGTSLFTGTFTSLTGGSSQVLYNMDLSQSAITGNTIYAVNVSPTLRNTASGQTQVALRVMPTFTGSSTGTSTTNKIVDFGSAGVGTQFTVTDATTGDIYMVNDVSGLPIIAANSSWDVSMYNYPNTVFKKTNNSLLLGVQNNTGSTVSIYGDLVINEGFGFTNTTTQVSGTTSTGATSAATIYTLTTSTNKSYSITCLTTGYGNTTRNTTSGRVEGAFRNSGGTLTMVGTTIQYVSANIESTNVDFEVSGTSIVLRVTGTTSENYTWGSTITSQVI